MFTGLGQYVDQSGYPLQAPISPMVSFSQVPGFCAQVSGMNNLPMNAPSMKAVRVQRFGGPEVLQVDCQVPVPQVGEEQVMVRVIFAGINPVI